MLNVLRSLGPARLAAIGAVTAALLGFFAFLSMKMLQPPMALLFGGLELQDSGQIVSRLEQMKIPYELKGNGQQILVPEDQVLRLRMTMAQGGMPAGGSIGYEIFDRQDALGTTNFVQSINHLRALEGEIARTIRSIDQVANARVHLVLPKREVFSREQREPSASIVLKMKGAQRLDRSQVQAVQNLVAAAVPDLKPSRISIVDDRGNLLAKGADERDPSSQTAGNMAEMKAAIEERMRRSIESLIERSVGPGAVRAEVTVDLDYDRIVTNQELFDPDGQVVRSTQTVSENSSSTEQDGGASNVTVQNNLPEAQQRENQNRSQTTGGRTEETVNYEISKTIRTQTREAGIIKRLSVAVLVDGVYATKDGGAREYTPRSDAELAQLATLARSAVGFNQQRGDSVEVVNMRFAGAEDIGFAADTEGLLGLGKGDLFRLGERLGIAIIALLALFLVFRPLIGRLLAIGTANTAATAQLAGPGLATLPQGVDPARLPPGIAVPQLPGPDGALPAELTAPRRTSLEQMIDVARVEGQVKASSIKKIGEIVGHHPEEAVSIMRSWLYQGST